MLSQNGLRGHTAINERIDSIASELKSVADRLSSAAASLKDRAADAGSHARTTAGSLADRAGRTIQDHPIAAIGVAFGAGFLLMRLIRR